MHVTIPSTKNGTNDCIQMTGNNIIHARIHWQMSQDKYFDKRIWWFVVVALLCTNECRLLLLLSLCVPFAANASRFSSWCRLSVILLRRFIYSIYLIMFALVFSPSLLLLVVLLLFSLLLLLPFAIHRRTLFNSIFNYNSIVWWSPIYYDGILLLAVAAAVTATNTPWPLPQFHAAVFHCNMLWMCVIDQLFRTFRIVSI